MRAASLRLVMLAYAIVAPVGAARADGPLARWMMDADGDLMRNLLVRLGGPSRKD
jgi:hypothetical protein